MVGVGRSAAFARAEDRGMARAGKGYDPVGNNFCVIDRAEAEARAYRDSDRRRHVCAVRGHCRSEEHTSELQSLMRISYAVFCLKKKKRILYQAKQNTPHQTPPIPSTASHKVTP